MRKMLKLGAMMLVVMFLANSNVLAQGRGNGGKGDSGGGSSAPILSPDEEAGLLQMREEEKLARDVYLYLSDRWGQTIFENIAGSEQRHMDAIKNLLDKYGLSDPSTGKAEGEFSDGHIQDLYNTLITTGSESLSEAFQVGATIEDLDIFDLEELVAETDKQDITRVYLNLLKGSRNHLRAFGTQLDSQGKHYVAEYLSQNEIDAIINSPKERGRY